MNIYSIGFTGKTAEEFFTLLKENNVKKIIDIRLNRDGQLSAFAKYPDLEYFLKLHDIEYVYYEYLAPSEGLRKRYNDKKSEHKMTFEEYTVDFNQTMQERNAIMQFAKEEKNLDGSCFLCSEDYPDECHRYLVIEELLRFLLTINFNEVINVIHLISYKCFIKKNIKNKQRKETINGGECSYISKFTEI